MEIIRELDKEEREGGNYVKGLKQYLCRCDCGTLFKADSRKLKRKNPKCSQCISEGRRLTGETSNLRHGMCGTRFYRCWQAMRNRCEQPSTTYYYDYGGRGISYDVRWKLFLNFYEDMHEGYEDHLELDRVDVNGDYTKGNCRWSSESLQGYNQRQRNTNTTGRTGVYRTRDGKWWAEIQCGGETKYLGRFGAFEDACAAREKAEYEIYGFSKM